jgi:hypothetical protein
LTALISGGSSLSQADKADDLNQKLSFRVPEGRVEGTFVEALGETARVFNIPMGISFVNTASSQRKRAVEYSNATVLEIIEDIAKTEPDYEVRVANNVVHVATKGVPDAQNFLTLKIPQFSGDGVAAVVKAGRKSSTELPLPLTKKFGSSGSRQTHIRPLQALGERSLLLQKLLRQIRSTSLGYLPME